MTMYEHIAVAVDGSENAMRAVRNAVELARVNADAHVSVLSVIAIDVYSDMVYDPVEAHGDTQKELVEPAIAAFREAGVSPELVLLHGRPADEIIHWVADNDVDVLVVGSRGLNSLQEFAIGSVSHKVMKHVKCPVLVVK